MNTFLQCFTTFLYQVDVVCKSQVVYSLSLNQNSCPIILDTIHHSFQICNKYVWRYWITLSCSYCSWRPFSYFLSNYFTADFDRSPIFCKICANLVPIPYDFSVAQIISCFIESNAFWKSTKQLYT